ncbi:DUF2500 domain-containing protein [Paenibacillus soyae]|uniref:DUF2500 domain-containing protein n=1 Tax=Paenibacillus soyae TaxID=2969249 RepID=A0A9X2MP08_9BACL|nr:DUF2500 domain-containing protein [Paenibacillus soyae]MCR2803582.1 DUF2500 domain-containing protein [Paenibacillus soyae]
MGPGPSFGDSGFDFMFNIFPFLFFLVFALIIGGIIFSIVKYMRNSRSPEVTSYATVVAKRMDVRHHSNHHHNNEIGHAGSSSRTYYYITLQFDNGVRKEFLDVKNLFGLVVEGDRGYAATKGEWIVAFERSAG